MLLPAILLAIGRQSVGVCDMAWLLGQPVAPVVRGTFHDSLVLMSISHLRQDLNDTFADGEGPWRCFIDIFFYAMKSMKVKHYPSCKLLKST
ncbi:MAG: hypothetical protein BYD32DRAFT_415571 [Podila humilis]|nr:MAG: hypothetical protein BYD32DRAFT_415571 [Podila humilis]